MGDAANVGLGVIGCGGFGLFALQHFTQVDGVKLQPKMHRYGELLRAMLADQLAWIRDRHHPRRITEQNGRDSLAMAVAASNLASS